MIELLTLLGAFWLGFYARTALDTLKRIERRIAEPDVPSAVTMGAEKPPTERWTTQENSAIIEPKTPQRIQWEAEQELNKQNLNIYPKK